MLTLLFEKIIRALPSSSRQVCSSNFIRALSNENVFIKSILNIFVNIFSLLLLGIIAVHAQTIVLTVTPSTNFTSATNISNDFLNVRMMHFSVVHPGGSEGGLISSFAFSSSGSGDESLDIAAVKLYRDVNNNGTIEVGDIQIGGAQSFSIDDGDVFFLGANETIIAGATNNYLLTFDFNGSAPDGSTYRPAIIMLSATGASSGAALIASGVPSYGNSACVLFDNAGPSFFHGAPFASASPAFVPTNLTLKINTDEPVFSGGLLIITNFSGGTGTNLIYDSSVTIATCAISAGRLQDPITNTPAADANDDDTVYNATTAETFQNHGIITTCYLASSGNINDGTVSFNIASNRGGNNLVLMYSTNIGNLNSAQAWSNYPTPAWEVFPGNMVGYYEDDNAQFISFDGAASCQRLYRNNDSHAGTELFTAVNGRAPAVAAAGYAVADYYSPVYDTVTGGSNYYRIIWSEISNGGRVLVALRCDDNTNLTSPGSWTNVTNGMYLTNVTALSNRFLQYRITLYASTNGEDTPEVSYLRILYNVTNRPVVSAAQSNYTDSAVTNYQFVYSNDSAQRFYDYTNTLRTGYNGELIIHAAGFDVNGNLTTNQFVGSLIVDGQIPNVTNVTCWQNANFTGTVSNGIISYDNLISYRFFSTNTASSQRFFYVYTANPADTVNETMSSTTNNYLLNHTLTAGTNYLIVRARNEAGTWGNPFVFTNVYSAPPFFVDIGANTPPDRYLVNNANNTVLMQLRMQAGAVGYHVYYLKFKANGTLNDASDFTYNSLKLYLDDGNGTFEGSETLLCGDRSFSGDDGFVSFDSFTNTIPANSEANIFVVAGLSGTAASNKTFYLSFEGADAMSNVAMDNSATNVVTGVPVYANTNTITLLGTLYANYGPQNPSQSIINNDDVNVPMLQMAIGTGPEESVAVDTITISAGGSGDDNNHIVANGVRLINDMNTNGIYDAGDVPVSGGQTYSADNGSISFTAVNMQVNAGSTNYLLVVYDFNGTAPSQADFQMRVDSISAVGMNSSSAVTGQGMSLIGSKKVVLLDLTGPQYFTGTPFVTPLYVTNTNVVIQIIPDENTYVGGTNYTDVLFAQGSGTNVSRVTSNLTMTILNIFAGNTNVTTYANAGSGQNQTMINDRAANRFLADGVVTRYIGMSRTASRTFYVSAASNRTALGPNFWQGYAIRSRLANTANTPYSISNLSIQVKSNHGVYINVRSARAAGANVAGLGVGYRMYNGNALGTAVDYATDYASPRFVFVGAVGYATALFYSTNMPFAAGYSNALRMSWSNDLTGGGTITMRVRGADTLGNLASAPWYTVNKNTVPNALTNDTIRFVQYEASMTAAVPEGGTVSPKLVSFSIDYGWKNYPIVYTVQPGDRTNYAIYLSGSNTGTYRFTNNIADTNGTVDVYATARDYFGNWASNVYVGTFIYDRSRPDITNLKCYTTPAQSFEVSNNVEFYDEIVSFSVSNKVDSPSGVYYYYTLNSNPDTNSIITEIATYSTNATFNDIGLPVGTNYFHVRAKTYYGVWGNETVFTNIFKRPELNIEVGTANPPATNVITGTGDVPVLQLRMRTKSATGMFISNISFTASGSAHDVNDFTSLRIYDDNGNGTLDAGDTLLGSNVYNADNGLVTFTNINYTFSANQTRYMLLTYDTKSSATIGSTFAAGITNRSGVVAWFADLSDNVSNIQYFPLWGNTNTFFRTAAVTLSAGAKNPSSTNVASNTADLLMLQFTAAVNDGEAVKLSNITIRASGTGDDTFDVTSASVRLYLDNNANGAIDGGDTLLGSGSYNSNDGVFSLQNINRILTPNSVTNFIVVQSFSGNATNGKWFRVSLETNTAFTVYGTTTGNSISVTGAPVNGGTVNIGVDTTPPYFSPYGGFVSLNPSPLTNSLYIYIQVDEKVKSTNGPGATVTNYPIIRVVQSNASQCTTNTATWISGLTNGPFTNSYAVQNFDGKAYVYAEGFDLASPSNWTNMLVGTFMVDVTSPASFITNYSTYDSVTNTNINVMMYALETNVIVSITVTTASNGGSVISFISNRSITGSNYTFTNVALSNFEGYTNWLTITVQDAASNMSNSASIGVIYAATPVITCIKSNIIYSPLNNYASITNVLIPGSIIHFFLTYTNAGYSMATNIVFEDYFSANVNFMTGSGTGADFYGYATNGVYSGYTPSGIVDTNVNRIKFNKYSLSAGASGTMQYRVIVR